MWNVLPYSLPVTLIIILIYQISLFRLVVLKVHFLNDKTDLQFSNDIWLKTIHDSIYSKTCTIVLIKH